MKNLRILMPIAGIALVSLVVSALTFIFITTQKSIELHTNLDNAGSTCVNYPDNSEVGFPFSIKAPVNGCDKNASGSDLYSFEYITAFSITAALNVLTYIVVIYGLYTVYKKKLLKV